MTGLLRHTPNIVMSRVYHFLLDHRIGGPHVYVDTLRKALASGIESTVVTTGQGPMTEFALLNLRHLWSPLYGVELVLNAMLLVGAVELGRISRKDTVFHVHGGANIAPLLAARLVGIPVLWQMHETTSRFRRLVGFGRRLLKGTRHSLAVVANKSVEVYDLDDAVLLPAAVDTMFWSPGHVSETDRAACGWQKESNDESPALRLVAVGNLNPLKGMDILLDALRGLEGRWHLKIVGSELVTHRQYAESLYRSAKELHTMHPNSQVDFLGWQANTSVRALLADCDIFVLPSRSEACPIALLEALAMDCCCIAADVGDVRLMMAHTTNGKIVKANSAAEFRKAILALQANCKARQMRKPVVGSAWNLNSLAIKTEAIYKSLI